MIRIHSQTQLTLEGFETPFERSMDKNNRWIKLSACIPWDDLANAYYQSFNASTGRPAKDAQLVIGAVIIKHRLKLSDEETVAQIQENPYLQYFCGLKGFSIQAPFAPSLLVEIRSIFLGAVDWIGHDGFWIKTVTSLIGFDLCFEIATFIEGIPAQVIDFSNALWREAHTYLGTELNRFIKFATNNRAYMRLMDTDDSVIAAMTFSAIHLCLLAIDMLNHPILF